MRMTDAATITRRGAMALGLALLAAGCGTPPPAPTTVQLAVAGTADMNNAAPTKVQVFYLASAAKFQTADYFALAQNAGAALGQDLVAQDEYIVTPGGSVKDAKSFAVPVTHVGVVAGFRDISRAAWRGVAPLAPNAPNPVAVSVTAAAVAVKSGS